jgi:hypothetical protein
MAFLLAQADFLTRDSLMAGVVEETVEEDTLLDRIMFEDIAGHKQVVWNRENSLGAGAVWREVNEEIAESAPTYSNQTQKLSILSTRVEIDNFEAATKGAVQAVIPRSTTAPHRVHPAPPSQGCTTSCRRQVQT